MKILVTGATGFVGSHLTDLLHKQGHQLYCLVRNNDKALEFMTKGNLVFGSLTPVGELQWLDSLPRDLDIIIHTAGVVHSNIASKFFEYNTRTTNNLIDQVFTKFPNIHFTFISSLAATGPRQNHEINEETIANPVSDYGRSKLLSETYLKTFKDKSYSIIRPPMVIGPRDPAILDIFKMVKSGIVIGPGLNFKTKEYSFVNVLDLVHGIAEVTCTKSHGDFFIANSKTILFKDLIDEIKAAMNKSYVVYLPIPHLVLRVIGKILKYVPIKSRLTSDKVNELIQNNWSCNSNKFRKINSQYVEYTINSTILETLNDYKKRKWI